MNDREDKGRKPIAAAIFDLDGTLVDSEENHYESDRLLMLRRGIRFTKEAKAAYVGKDIHEMVRGVVQDYGLTEDPAALVREKSALYRELALRSTRMYPPIRPLLEGLAKRGIPMAIATGSDASIGGAILESLGVRRHFSLIVSSVEVGRGKPAPDIFLEAARRLNVAPEECIVFEDTAWGVEAALRAGMECVALPAPGADLPADLAQHIGYLVPDALDPEDFFRWFDAPRVSTR